MKKVITFLTVVIATVLNTFAAITISTSAKTFDKAGGAASITISGDGSWTATSDSVWISIAQGAAGTGAGSCVYIVNANNTADTRIGHIDVAGNVYTITQYGYGAIISPMAATYDRLGGSGSIEVTVDAGISWTAVANDEWIKVSPQSGISVGKVGYEVAEYVGGVVTRVGSITIGGQTFTVTQSGVDVSISPESTVKAASAGIISVSITALVGTKWDVVPNDSWISIIDKATGYGDYVLTLAIASNPSFERRTGTVSIGSATLTVIQDGLSTASLSINPENATASASGAYGNVAVYATPDAPWTATSLTSWLTISEGRTGSGNGNIKYVASANPTLEERTGQIVIMPPHKVVDPDLYRGLLFWIKEQNNIEGNESRSTTYSLSKSFDGSFKNQLTGAVLPARESFDFTFACQFKIGELNRVNRLFQLGRSPRQFYLDEQNVLHYDYSANDSTLYSSVTPFRVTEANKWYTILIRHETTKESGGDLSIYCGESGGMLTRINKKYEGAFFPLNTSVSIGASFVLGYTTLPTAGYLTDGQFGNLRFWNRALSDFECDRVDVLQSANQCDNKVPAGVPEGVKWRFWPLDGNGYRTLDSTMNAQVVSTALSGWTDCEDRFGSPNSCLTSAGSGKIRLDGFETFFDGTSILNNGKTLRNTYLDYSYTYDYRYYPYPATASADAILDATYSIWFCPHSLDGIIMSRIVDYSDGYGKSVSPQDKNTSLVVKLVDGKIELSGTGVATTKFSNVLVKANEWHMLSIVGKAESSIQVYLDGTEMGNVSSTMTLGFLPKIDKRYYSGGMHGSAEPCATMTIGGISGAVDDFAIYQAALTSAQIRELFNRQRDLKVYHTVSQGVQIAQLNKTKDTAPAEGCTSSVALTLAQSVKWSAKSNNDWITITSGTEGAGSASVEYTVGANPAVTPRTGSITVAGIALTITQEPLWADVSCEDTSFGVESDSGFIWVDTEGAGQWTAKTDADWIHLLTTSGNGPDTVLFVVDDYATTTESRSGKITIAGKQVIVTQQGYELSIDPMIAEIGSNAGAGQFGVAAPIDAVWEAIADCDWITIIGSRNGIGNGVIQYSVADNKTGETRTGRIIVSGQAYTITQRTTLPVVASIIGQGNVTGAGDYTQGSDINLKATPANGYVFSHWSGDAVGTDPDVTIKVDIGKNVTATFIPETAAQVLVEKKAAQGGFYTRDQIHALEMGSLVFDVDSSGTARVGVQLMETSDLSDPNSWKPATLSSNPDVGQDGTVGMKVKAEGNAKFFKVVMPEQK